MSEFGFGLPDFGADAGAKHDVQVHVPGPTNGQPVVQQVHDGVPPPDDNQDRRLLLDVDIGRLLFGPITEDSSVEQVIGALNISTNWPALEEAFRGEKKPKM